MSHLKSYRNPNRKGSEPSSPSRFSGVSTRCSTSGVYQLWWWETAPHLVGSFGQPSDRKTHATTRFQAVHVFNQSFAESVPGLCSTPNQLLICSSFSRENSHPLLICSSLSTSQVQLCPSLIAIFDRGSQADLHGFARGLQSGFAIIT